VNQPEDIGLYSTEMLILSNYNLINIFRWAENLNSVLDDNKLLTLPNGERLAIPSNVRMIFEVETLKYATLATVSRCGMVWFSEETIASENIFFHFLERLK
jgi:dynein heavy chain 1